MAHVEPLNNGNIPNCFMHQMQIYTAYLRGKSVFSCCQPFSLNINKWAVCTTLFDHVSHKLHCLLDSNIWPELDVFDFGQILRLILHNSICHFLLIFT
jgi:hypothetical protein